MIKNPQIPYNERMGIKDIARMSGVSISTVSRVLNGTKPVSPELEQRVREAIEKENYVPNHSARSMVLRRTNLIGLLLPRVSGMFHQKVFYLLESKLEEQGYKLIVCNIKDNDTSEISYLNLLKQKEVDGIILCHESRSDRINSFLNASAIPVVQCAIHIPEIKWPSFFIDPEKAVFDGVSYLISLNHQKIGMICSDSIKDPGTDPQISGYKRALQSAGIPFEPDYLIPGAFSLSSGKDVTEKLIKVHPELTALFYVSDEMAIGGYKALTRMGLRVGGDVAIIGYDGIDVGEYVLPSLTTIGQPVEEITERTIRTLQALMGSPDWDEETLTDLSEVLDHSLRLGASCSKL